MTTTLDECVLLLGKDDRAAINDGFSLLSSLAAEQPDIVGQLGEPFIDQSGWLQIDMSTRGQLWGRLSGKVQERLKAWLFHWSISTSGGWA